MKHFYTFNNYNYNNLKSYLNNNAKKAFPWLFNGDYTDTRDFINTYYAPYSKKEFSKRVFNNCPCYNCPFKETNNDYTLDDLDDAIYKLQNYKTKYDLDNYDYKILGMPVKVYQNFVQIGYNIIPRDEYGHILIAYIPKKEYTTIINIINTIEINLN